MATRTVDTRIGPIELQCDYPSDASVQKLYDELDFQRAVQAYIWATPLVSSEALRRANLRDWGVDFNDVSIIDEYTTPTTKVLTGNNTTIYAGIFADLERDGPVVIDSPEGVYGVIDDFWQRPIVEVGPFGPDRGKGGRFLLLPPGFSGSVPDGYLPAPSLAYRHIYVGRAFVKDGNVAAAVKTLEGIRVYPLSQASAPAKTKVLRSGGKPMDSIPPRGYGYWEILADAIAHEPVEPRDRFFHAMLKPLGIEKGQPFNPDARQKKILSEAAEVGFLMAQTLSAAPRLSNASSYPGTKWEWVLTLNPDQEADSYSQLDERTDYTFEAYSVAAGMIKPIVGAGSQYMSTAKDKSGAWLDGGKNYRLRVPANVPVKEFWSVTVYDNMTRSMIQTDTNKAGLDSHQKLQVNTDGSVDLFFGPTTPAGLESNWVKTITDRAGLPTFAGTGQRRNSSTRRGRCPTSRRCEPRGVKLTKPTQSDDPEKVAVTPVSDQDISDAYTYLLGRLLLTRQQQLDFREGFKWTELVHRKPGEVDWPNPNLDVAYSEAWVAVDEHSCLLVQVPNITGRYYTVQFLNGWGETVANINERVIADHPSGQFAICLKGSTVPVPPEARRIDLPVKYVRVLARVEQERVRRSGSFPRSSSTSCRSCWPMPRRSPVKKVGMPQCSR